MSATINTAPKRARPHFEAPEHFENMDHADGEHASHKRPRLEGLDDAAQQLFESMYRHVHSCLAARERQDKMQREKSLMIAREHPLTFGVEKGNHAQTRSVSPHVSSPPADMLPSYSQCKETPCLAPTPICSTPMTTAKEHEYIKGGPNFAMEPPVLKI